MILPNIKTGDAIRVWWYDITEGVTSNPADVKPDIRCSPAPPASATFLGWHESQVEVAGEKRTIRYLLTSGDYSVTDKAHVGGCVYPEGCILAIELVSKRAGVKRKRKVKDEGPSGQ